MAAPDCTLARAILQTSLLKSTWLWQNRNTLTSWGEPRDADTKSSIPQKETIQSLWIFTNRRLPQELASEPSQLISSSHFKTQTPNFRGKKGEGADERRDYHRLGRADRLRSCKTLCGKGNGSCGYR